MMRSFRSKPVGWRYESSRHSLAAKGVCTTQRYEVRKYAPSRVIGRHRSDLAGSVANVFAGRERKVFSDARSAGQGIEDRAKLQRNLVYRPLSGAEEQQRESEISHVLSTAEGHREFLLNSRNWREVAADRRDRLNREIADYESASKKEDRSVRAELKRNIKRDLRDYERVKRKMNVFRIRGYDLDFQVYSKAKNLVRGSKKLR